MSSEYLTFPQIREAMPEALGWTEDDLIRVCRQSRSPLKFVRLHSRNSPAMWRRDDVLAFMQRRYGKTAPELVDEFALRLNLPRAVDKKQKVRKP